MKHIVRTLNRALVLVLCTLFILYAFPAEAAGALANEFADAQTGTESVPEEPAAVGAQGEAESVFEVVSRRTESTKHFHLGNGSYAAVSYGMPVHELDADGAWQDIDNRLGDSGSDYATPDAKVKFAKKITGSETGGYLQIPFFDKDDLGALAALLAPEK